MVKFQKHKTLFRHKFIKQGKKVIHQWQVKKRRKSFYEIVISQIFVVDNTGNFTNMIRHTLLAITAVLAVVNAKADVLLKTSNVSISGSTMTFDVEIAATTGSSFTLGTSYLSRNQQTTVIDIYIGSSYNSALTSAGDMAFTGVTWVSSISSNYTESNNIVDVGDGTGYVDLMLKGDNGATLFAVTTSYQKIATITVGLASGTTSANTGTITIDAGYSTIYNSNNGTENPGTFDNNATTNTMLPVSLRSFETHFSNGFSTLNWTTSTEENNDGFEVQRSMDGHTFETIGFVKGAGNSINNINYQYTDNNLPAGIALAYYRLKQIDFDGKYSYSTIKAVNIIPAKADINWYPNPVSQNLAIVSKGALNVEIFDVFGKRVFTGNSGIANQLDLSSLAHGTYVIRFSDLNGNVVKQDRLIKQ